MPTVHKHPKATDDLFEIWIFIATDNENAADSWIDRLDAQFALLSSQPLIGRVRDELFVGLRSFPFGRYVIFYLPDTNGITVVRVLHSARDLDAAMDLH